MACSGRYAEAWQFGAFWCISGYLSGVDDSGGAGNPSLQSLQANFVSLGVKANVGMILYNVTTGLSGPVTAVTTNTLTATGVTWSDGDKFRIATLTGTEIATIESYLDITAADLNAALAATASCECTFQSWVYGWLQKLNIIEAATFYNCPCGSPKMDSDDKRAMLDWVTNQLEQLRNGNITVCVGDTGKEFPAVGWAEIAHTPWESIEIVQNRIMRNGS